MTTIKTGVKDGQDEAPLETAVIPEYVAQGVVRAWEWQTESQHITGRIFTGHVLGILKNSQQENTKTRDEKGEPQQNELVPRRT